MSAEPIRKSEADVSSVSGVRDRSSGAGAAGVSQGTAEGAAARSGSAPRSSWTIGNSHALFTGAPPEPAWVTFAWIIVPACVTAGVIYWLVAG